VGTLFRLLERALRQAGKVSEAELAHNQAEKIFQNMVDAQSKTDKPTETKATPLPSKLVITASKKLLDDVGSGKMSFDDFKKAVSVEYVTFPAEKK
jgi:hypothetical protein